MFSRENFTLMTSVIGLIVDLAGIYGYLSFLRIPDVSNTHSLPTHLLLIILLFYFLGVCGYILLNKHLKKTKLSPKNKGDTLLVLVLGYSFFSWLPFYSLWYYAFSLNISQKNILGLIILFPLGFLVGTILMCLFIALLYVYIPPHKTYKPQKQI